MIITDAGDAFCVGLDMNDVPKRGEPEKSPAAKSPAEKGQAENTGSLQTHPTQRVLRTCPFQISKPVVCAINGGAGGFGAAYFLTCDIRLAADDAAIAFSFVK
ncbi:MAG: enoyl-CoA hydratase/carnithine racemase [Candidatus Azotimanducaceae bacterium]